MRVCVRLCVMQRKVLFLSKNISKFFPFSLPSERDRDPKNILYYQRNVENLTDQVLDFLLFDKDEYTDGIFGL